MDDDERPRLKIVQSRARDRWVVILVTVIFIVMMAWVVSTLF